MLMGYREYARHRGVTLGAVQKAIKSKRIYADENGKIDSDVADRDWDANTDASRVAVNVIGSQAAPVQQQSMQLPLAADLSAAPAQPRPDLPAPAATASAGDKDGDEVGGNDRIANDYREHRATRERYQALKQQLEYEQLVGKSIDVEEAGRIVFTSFRALRDSMTNVSIRIKDRVAVESDPDVCEQIIDAEISAALAGIDVTKLLRDQSETDE